MTASPALADTGGLSAYLSARAAAADGRADAAARDYARVLAQTPDPAIATRAYREALAAGDEALATRALAILIHANVAPPDAALIPLARAARADDGAAATAAIETLKGGPLIVLAPALSGWVAFAGKRDPAPVLAATGKDPVAARFVAETGALLAIAAGRSADGAAALAARDDRDPPGDLRIAAAQLLLGQGRDAAARALLTKDARLPRPAKPTLGFGVSRLLTRIAADLVTGRPTPLSIALTRAALSADPSYDRARILLADALAKAGAAPRALATLDRVDRESPDADDAAAARIAILSGTGRDAEALVAARRDATREDASSEDWWRYADLLAAADRPVEAIAYYRRALDRGEAGWSAWMQYGGALDRAGRWPEARAALEKAVALGPTQPLALNFLGFARAERGDDLPAAVRTLERARALDPENASIADSLGWAYHLSGDTRRALPLLERAAKGEGANAEIGEHLGDAYWTLGRRYEARYAWRAAALTADSHAAARLSAKIASGLPEGARR